MENFHWEEEDLVTEFLEFKFTSRVSASVHQRRYYSQQEENIMLNVVY
ncbi:hypothetical protein PY093_21025 [Cytobacillus sp. S13-E01]|nr:hypothetical protein [Cytobacillus sp. S13-E01]MDF0729093.1 hypothetical protein [Cytobacillus sp. S13-E01]